MVRPDAIDDFGDYFDVGLGVTSALTAPPRHTGLVTVTMRRRPAAARAGWVAAVAVLVSVWPWSARPALAQAVPHLSDIDLGRLFAVLPGLFERVFQRGSTEFFRLLENIEILHIESEVDRYVGRPRELNDSTAYKLRLLPYTIEYPIFRPLVDQMTRLDSVRSNRIYTVMPDSVTLVDLRIQPVRTLEEFTGQGQGSQVESSLLHHFTAREIADLAVLILAQQPFFPETDDDWQRTKHDIAKAGVPLVLGALAAGAAFDAGALTNSGPILRRGDQLELRYYGGFRNFGVHLHPYLRGGVSLRVPGIEAAAGVADQIRPTALQSDSTFELAVRDGWLSQFARPLGWDAFFEAAFRQSIRESPGFTGDHAKGRAGFFFKRDQLPRFPDLGLRGSMEAESNFTQHLHLVGALGVERRRSGLTTMVQGSLVPAEPTLVITRDDARLTVFVVGTMEPITASFVDEMTARARATREEVAELEDLDRRRDAWDKGLLARGVAARSPAETRAMLTEREQLLIDGERRLTSLASTLADYLESRDRAYAILNQPKSLDLLHGPVDAAVVLAARGRVLSRLRALSGEMSASLARLEAVRRQVTRIEEELPALEATAPQSPSLAALRRDLAQLQEEWTTEADHARQQLATRERLRIEGRRILDATESEDGDTAIRRWDTLNAFDRARLARLATTSGP